MEREKIVEQAHAHEAGVAENHVNTLHSEADLSDRDEISEDHHDHDDHHVDYTNYSKQQLAELIKELSRDDNFKKVDSILREIKPIYDDLREKERAEALAKFVAQGGTAEDFEFKGDEHDNVFDANLKLIRDRKLQYYKQQEERKTENLARKQEILEKLRVLSDSQDTTDQFEQFKELQKQWKAIGPVSGPQAKTLWANYHALLDRFYDNQSIYFELKELDRKKNLEAKLELC
ncbi:MAG TPA: DUF349 domain-containing protein, partial [Chryseolinea sp.]